jgi:hypothetical protein
LKKEGDRWIHRTQTQRGIPNPKSKIQNPKWISGRSRGGCAVAIAGKGTEVYKTEHLPDFQS